MVFVCVCFMYFGPIVWAWYYYMYLILLLLISAVLHLTPLHQLHPDLLQGGLRHRSYFVLDTRS